jgi:hypothetical protein
VPDHVEQGAKRHQTENKGRGELAFGDAVKHKEEVH